jgi:hypothetical protein
LTSLYELEGLNLVLDYLRKLGNEPQDICHPDTENRDPAAVDLGFRLDNMSRQLEPVSQIRDVTVRAVMGTSIDQQQQYWLWIPALVVSICALIFTLASFWWLNARQGHLKSYEPHSFAALVSGSTILQLRFPLVLHNTGPKPIVVQSFLLRFPDEPKSVIPLSWRATYSELKPHKEDGEKVPAIFAVPGRSAEQHFIEFGGLFPGFVLAANDCRVEITTKLGHRKKWKPLLSFTLRASRISFPDEYIVYRNLLYDQTEDDKAKLSKAFVRLSEFLRQAQVSDETEN